MLREGNGGIASPLAGIERRIASVSGRIEKIAAEGGKVGGFKNEF